MVQSKAIISNVVSSLLIWIYLRSSKFIIFGRNNVQIMIKTVPNHYYLKVVFQHNIKFAMNYICKIHKIITF